MAIADSIRMNLLWHRPSLLASWPKKGRMGQQGLLCSCKEELSFDGYPPFHTFPWGTFLDLGFRPFSNIRSGVTNSWTFEAPPWKALEIQRDMSTFTRIPTSTLFLDFVWTSQKCPRSVSFDLDHFWDSNKSLDMSRDNMWLPCGVRLLQTRQGSETHPWHHASQKDWKEQEKDRNSSQSHSDFFQLWWFLIVICLRGPIFSADCGFKYLYARCHLVHGHAYDLFLYGIFPNCPVVYVGHWRFVSDQWSRAWA